MPEFRGAIQYLAQIGVADVIIPFIIVFTVVFAVLRKTKILGEKRYDVMIALVMGLGIVIPHVLGAYPEGADLVVIMNSFLPNVSLFAIVIVMVLLILGVFGYGLKLESGLGGILALISALIVLYIFGATAGWWGVPGTLGFVLDPDTQAFLIIILVFGIIIWAVTHEPKPQGTEAFKSFKDLFKPLGP